MIRAFGRRWVLWAALVFVGSGGCNFDDDFAKYCELKGSDRDAGSPCRCDGTQCCITEGTDCRETRLSCCEGTSCVDGKCRK